MELNIGDTLIFDCKFEYRGPAYTKAFLRCSIGTRGTWGFGEILHTEADIEIPDTPSWKTYPFSIPVDIISVISPGADYDLEVKLGGIPGDDLFWKWDNVIDIIGAGEGEFKNLSVNFRKA